MHQLQPHMNLVFLGTLLLLQAYEGMLLLACFCPVSSLGYHLHHLLSSSDFFSVVNPFLLVWLFKITSMVDLTLTCSRVFNPFQSLIFD